MFCTKELALKNNLCMCAFFKGLYDNIFLVTAAAEGYSKISSIFLREATYK